MNTPRRRITVLATALFLGVAGLAALATPSSGADPGSGDAFSPVPGFRATGAKVRVRPSSYAAFRVDTGAVRAQLDRRSSRAAGDEATVVLPDPSGQRVRFAVQPTTVMESGLAAAHPEITTYAGRSLDTPGATVALDLTPMGLHASVRGPVGTRAWYVDPAYDLRGTNTVLSYYGAAVPPHSSPFVEGEAQALDGEVIHAGAAPAPAGGLVTQRIYRLALTSDPTYAAYFGTENVLAEKVTLINRVNQVYNDDLAINLRLVDATDRLNLDTEAKATGANGPCGAHPCFDPPGADPETQPGQLDFCSSETLDRNTTVLGQLVGASNYDIGHLALGVAGGGLADLRVVGRARKAGGCTGVPTPEGDLYAVDYVSHEMGHQFGGNHTFDGVKRNCGFGNRHGPSSVEPGSGSSVMAYAGICAQDNLQPHSDPYFSQRSQTEITSYVSSAPYRDVEVQTVSLRGFDTDGDSVTLGFRNRRPVTLTRGVNYTSDGVTQALRRLTGRPVTVAKWGYRGAGDPKSPDDTGFQVTFADASSPPEDATDIDPLLVVDTSAGVGAEVGETVRGGLSDNGGSTVRTTPDHAPVVTAPADRTLPLRTPFTLTGSGVDADGDTLTYLWEQNDTGATGTLDGTPLLDRDRVLGPLFRVFGQAAPVSKDGTLESPSPGENQAALTPNRTFPDLTQVLADNTNAASGRCPVPRTRPDGTVRPAALECYSELLPMNGYMGDRKARTPAMHFRLTARDGYPAGGGVAHDDVTLRLDPSAGPFRVRSQSTRTRLAPGSLVPVTWSVNGTDRLARSVRILLSTDGGRTFDRELAVTDNDGRADVVIPAVLSDNARIMVAAVDNYFFDVNHAPLRIS